MWPRGADWQFLRQLPVAVAFFSIKTFMEMPNGAEKKCQATDNRLRNVPLENIPATNNVLLPFEGHFFVTWTFICICKTFDNKKDKFFFDFFSGLNSVCCNGVRRGNIKITSNASQEGRKFGTFSNPSQFWQQL